MNLRGTATPLYLASAEGWPGVVEVLCDVSAEVAVCEAFGKTCAAARGLGLAKFAKKIQKNLQNFEKI